MIPRRPYIGNILEKSPPPGGGGETTLMIAVNGELSETLF